MEGTWEAIAAIACRTITAKSKLSARAVVLVPFASRESLEWRLRKSTGETWCEILSVLDEFDEQPDLVSTLSVLMYLAPSLLRAQHQVYMKV